jgi:hypothetical protein
MREKKVAWFRQVLLVELRLVEFIDLRQRHILGHFQCAVGAQKYMSAATYDPGTRSEKTLLPE